MTIMLFICFGLVVLATSDSCPDGDWYCVDDAAAGEMDLKLLQLKAEMQASKEGAEESLFEAQAGAGEDGTDAGPKSLEEMTFETIDANLTDCGQAVLDFSEEDACQSNETDLCNGSCKELAFAMLGACEANSSIAQLSEPLPFAGAQLLTQDSLAIVLTTARSGLATCNFAPEILPRARSFNRAQIVIGLRGSKWQHRAPETNSGSGIVIGLRGRKWRRRRKPSHTLNSFSHLNIVIGLRGRKSRDSHPFQSTLNTESSSGAIKSLAQSQIVIGQS
eukprot:CAMPEP_0197625440 /NCGR_PEP_ID=MMETSP1338-20131121/4810_1 /TAXON_ID=43686 ORGANISM="Pelagodinium beii, Strain RCC1491" /NCGR_SAMPLE_ID=MMETSP1338 /ASSEMBLY_ACC=CAM_ASM_000754 /LENGTH=276 /DNA_ID=CAMNT_0043195855 /DNA_START=71 /DNA_END=901 /DNA_ORIENTATION=-